MLTSPRLPSLAVVFLGLTLAIQCAPSPPAPTGRPSGDQAAPAAPRTDGPREPALQALIDAARAEGQLTLVWGEGTIGGTNGVRRIAEGLNREYGLNLNVQFTPGPSMANMMTKLTEESQADRRASTDVMVGYSNHMAALSQAGALTPVDWLAWAPHVRNPEQVAPNGVAVTFQTSFAGITYNTQRVSGDEIPRSLQDLLQPRYKGRIASTPYGANFDYLATDEVWGEQRTMDFLTRFADQIAGLIRCNESDRLASGEFELFALDCSQSNAYEAHSRGAPIDIVIPSDAALLIPLYVAVPRTAAHPNAGRLWVDYIVSREVQELLAETDFMDSHLLEGSKTAKQLEQLRAAGVQFTVTNVEFVQRQNDAEFTRRRTKVQQILSKQ
jgi:ABC-type Fe3+ transport system substrate-binding protein